MARTFLWQLLAGLLTSGCALLMMRAGGLQQLLSGMAPGSAALAQALHEAGVGAELSGAGT